MKAAANPVVDDEAPALTWGTYNGFAYVPAMPGAAMRVLLHLVGTQEPGGRCITTEDQLAEALSTGSKKMHRSQVGRGIQHLILARLVFRPTKGVYQLNPMISGFHAPADQLRAIDALSEEDRLDIDDFQERYERAVAQHEEDKRLRALRRQQGAGVVDLSEARRARGKTGR